MTAPQPGIAVEVTIAVPLATVWHALRDRETVRRWHGWDYEGIDAEIETIYFAGATADEEAHTLTTGDSRFELEPEGEHAARLRVTMPAPADGASWDAVYDDVREGWISFVEQLRFLLERRPGGDRRSFALSAGHAVDLGIDFPETPGAGYSGTTAWGESWSGTVAFRTTHQFGVSVDAYGPGLVIVHRKPQGGVLAIVGAYGTDPQPRWSQWWAAAAA